MDEILKRTLASLKNAEELGFVWPDYKALLSAVQSEVSEIEEVIVKQETSDRLCEEVGDLLLGCIEICRYFSISPTQSLSNAEEKFTKRFVKLKESLRREGKVNLIDESHQQRLSRWRDAKNEVSSEM